MGNQSRKWSLPFVVAPRVTAGRCCVVCHLLRAPKTFGNLIDHLGIRERRCYPKPNRPMNQSLKVSTKIDAAWATLQQCQDYIPLSALKWPSVLINLLIYDCRVNFGHLEASRNPKHVVSKYLLWLMTIATQSSEVEGDKIVLIEQLLLDTCINLLLYDVWFFVWTRDLSARS